MDSNRVCFMAHWLKVELKQLTLFFNKHISLSIIEEKEHAIETLECEAILAWQICVSISFFREVSFLETKSSFFEIEEILLFKDSFSFNTKSSFEVKVSFFSKQFHNHFYFSKFCFH